MDYDDDLEQAHLAALQQQLIQPSPLQPQNHDHLHRAPGSVLSTGPASVTDRGGPPSVAPATPSQNNSESNATNKSALLSGPLPTPASIMAPMTPMTPITPASTDPGIVPQLQNIVSTVNLGCKLDLKRIALHARNAEYNPKRFAAVIMRIREPRTTALIFSSGKMVCTGAKSEEQSRLAARKYARIVQKLGFEVCFQTHS